MAKRGKPWGPYVRPHATLHLCYVDGTFVYHSHDLEKVRAWLKVNTKKRYCVEPAYNSKVHSRWHHGVNIHFECEVDFLQFKLFWSHRIK